MFIYVFGSVCRGEVDRFSDIDMLAISKEGNRFDPKKYSIYTESRIIELWEEGNPFAWHLWLEARLIYTKDSTDFIKELGPPSNYLMIKEDCLKFLEIFNKAYSELTDDSLTLIFDLSTIFLALRNFATCISFVLNSKPVFSRDSAKLIGEESLCINQEAYETLKCSRILCTRGYGPLLTEKEVAKVLVVLPTIQKWMINLYNKIED